jgi:hypothetical protein
MKRFLLAAALVVLGLPAAHADLPEFASWLEAGSCPALPAVRSPEPELKTTCSISRNCGDGKVVSCTGSYCTNTVRGVQCNGVHHDCPNFCSRSTPCPPCGQVNSCISLSGNCTDNPVGCNGTSLEENCSCPDGPDQ